MMRIPRIDSWPRRLAFSIVLVCLTYCAFAVVAHLVDPRWPPLAMGRVRTAVAILCWPGSWIGAVLVVTGMNPFPRGWTYFSIWMWSVCTYVGLVFGLTSLWVWFRTSADLRT